MTNGDRAWLVTGASSGLGRAIAQAALARGDRVMATSRRLDALRELGEHERAHIALLDVTDGAHRAAAVSLALDRFGRIDVLVNSAGRTQVGAIEETTEEDLRELFELNFFGPASLTRLVLPHMRERGLAAIVQISSMSGQVGFPGFGAYCASKFALEGLSDALDSEVAALGIRTLIVEPGAFRTGVFGARMRRSRAIEAYAQTVHPMRARVEEMDGNQPGDPDKAAAAIIAVLDAPRPPLRLVLGADAIDEIRAKHERLGAGLDAWEHLSLDTEHDDAR
jgi:NAD(P)-dependent dehydrogenase (short-subunit alcohol dehydrogenase family)